MRLCPIPRQIETLALRVDAPNEPHNVTGPTEALRYRQGPCGKINCFRPANTDVACQFILYANVLPAAIGARDKHMRLILGVLGRYFSRYMNFPNVVWTV